MKRPAKKRINVDKIKRLRAIQTDEAPVLTLEEIQQGWVQCYCQKGGKAINIYRSNNCPCFSTPEYRDSLTKLGIRQ